MPDTYVPVGLDGILASTERLLATNRGLEEPDQRDSMPNDRILMPHDLLRERIKIDSGQARRKIMRYAVRHRSLRGLSPFAFDGYASGLLVGNPLSQPLEEINPTQVSEQMRRITKMGPGGIGDEQAITSGMQAVDEGQFGFISPIEGPECLTDTSEVYLKRGWVPWPEVRDDDVFACRIEGRLEWHQAERVIRQRYAGKIIVGEHETIRMAVTPTHCVFNTRDIHYRMDLAQDVFGRGIRVPIRHEPYQGDVTMTHFHLPEVARTNSNQKRHKAFAIADWCALVGWWLAEGCSSSVVRISSGGSPYTERKLGISQCPVANPAEHAEIASLLRRMNLKGDCKTSKNFSFGSKQLTAYFTQWSNGCYEKWIPEDLFEAPVHARTALLDALLKGDGRYNVKRWCYSTVSRRLAESVERLAISLGFTAFIREEKDLRPHVKTTNWVVSIHRQLHRRLMAPAYADPRSGKTYGNNWSLEDYNGTVYCATVPGGLLHVRGKKSNSGFWTGNSSRAGVDVRMSSGARFGSDGRIYQRVLDRDYKKVRWVSSEDLRDSIIKIPD